MMKTLVKRFADYVQRLFHRPDPRFVYVAGIWWAKSNLKIGNKEHFTHDEAVTATTMYKMTMPTHNHWQQLYICCNYHFDKQTREGVFTDKDTGAILRLPAKGWRYNGGELLQQYDTGSYWSSTQVNDNAINIHFDDDENIFLNPQGSSKILSLSVRCIKVENMSKKINIKERTGIMIDIVYIILFLALFLPIVLLCSFGRTLITISEILTEFLLFVSHKKTI